MDPGKQGAWDLGLGVRPMLFPLPFAGRQGGRVSGAGDSEENIAPDARRGRGSVMRPHSPAFPLFHWDNKSKGCTCCTRVTWGLDG